MVEAEGLRWGSEQAGDIKLEGPVLVQTGLGGGLNRKTVQRSRKSTVVGAQGRGVWTRALLRTLVQNFSK